MVSQGPGDEEGVCWGRVPAGVMVIERVPCPTCGKEVAIQRDGTYWYHKVRPTTRPWEPYRCPSVGYLVRKVVSVR